MEKVNMIAILADDLTSALDGAAPFAGKGLSARVMLQIPTSPEHNADIISFDLNSRFLEPEESSHRFELAADIVKHADIIYKTIDSTLRGNLGYETRGTLIGSKRKKALVIPAFPDAGRTTIKGMQYVHGLLLEHTEFAQDPTHPITTSSVAKRMEGLDSMLYHIFDAESNEDIDAVLHNEGLLSPVVWVGSPGIASALSRTVNKNKETRPLQMQTDVSRVLVIVGSLHQINQAQINRLLRSESDAYLITVTDDITSEAAAHEIRTAFLEHSVVCIITSRERTKTGTLSSTPSEKLGEIVALCASLFNGLVVTGGDTARRIVDAINASSLDLLGEVEPGVPFGILNTPGRNIPFSTKAGGFGNEETLFQCVQALRIKKDNYS
ncbi:four-carbon acid sugar kinase family protein [Aeromonas jandaei]